MQRVANPLSTSPLYVAPNEFDFGVGWEQGSHKHAFTLHNRTAQPIAITQWRTSCTCTDITPHTLEIPARGSASVAVTINLSAAYSAKADSPDQRLSISVEPILFSGVATQTAWTFSGKARRIFVEYPSISGTLDYLEPPKPRTILFKTHFPLTDADVTSSSPLLRASIRTLDGEAKSHQIDVSLVGDLTLGRFDSSLKLTGRSLGQDLPELPIPVIVDVLADVFAEPPFIHFGIVESELPSRQSLKLRSRHQRPFDVLEVQSPWPTLTVNHRSMEPGEPADVFDAVVADPENHSRGGKVVFTIRQERKTYSIPVGVTYVSRKSATATAEP